MAKTTRINPRFNSSQIKRLEKRFASLASGHQGSHSHTVSSSAFCSQPEVVTNVFVTAYVGRLLEDRQRVKGSDGRAGKKMASAERNGNSSKSDYDPGDDTMESDALTLDDFIHVYWVFSNFASNQDKIAVLDTLLEPDREGWVDRRSVFGFAKCVASCASDDAVEDITEGFMRALRDQNDPQASQRVPFRAFADQKALVDRFTVHM